MRSSNLSGINEGEDCDDRRWQTLEIVEGAEDEGIDDPDARELSARSTASSNLSGINEGEDFDEGLN
jgi:hypothetical protein